jgi:hypothetical protein
MKLYTSTYEPFGLEAIETASRDEVAAVQTDRLKRTLHTVYENVPAYRKKFDAAGVKPSDFRRKTCRNSHSPPSRICATTIPSGCLPFPRSGLREFTPPPARPFGASTCFQPKLRSRYCVAKVSVRIFRWNSAATSVSTACASWPKHGQATPIRVRATLRANCPPLTSATRSGWVSRSWSANQAKSSDRPARLGESSI